MHSPNLLNTAAPIPIKAMFRIVLLATWLASGSGRAEKQIPGHPDDQ
jgi:hypothetical protein